MVDLKDVLFYADDVEAIYEEIENSNGHLVTVKVRLHAVPKKRLEKIKSLHQQETENLIDVNVSGKDDLISWNDDLSFQIHENLYEFYIEKNEFEIVNPNEDILHFTATISLDENEIALLDPEEYYQLSLEKEKSEEDMDIISKLKNLANGTDAIEEIDGENLNGILIRNAQDVNLNDILSKMFGQEVNDDSEVKEANSVPKLYVPTLKKILDYINGSQKIQDEIADVKNKMFEKALTRYFGDTSTALSILVSEYKSENLVTLAVLMNITGLTIASMGSYTPGQKTGREVIEFAKVGVNRLKTESFLSLIQLLDFSDEEEFSNVRALIFNTRKKLQREKNAIKMINTLIEEQIIPGVK